MRIPVWLVGLAVLGCSNPGATTPPPVARPPVATAPTPTPTPTPTVAPAPRKPAGGAPWGEPVADPKTDLLVMRALSLIANSDPAGLGAVSEALVIAPGLWALMLQLDKDSKPPVIAKLGTDSKAVIPLGDGKQTMLAMRTFLDASDRKRLLAARPFTQLGVLFVSGKPRAATALERQWLYALVPFEIAGKPVTMVELPNGMTLLAVVESDRLFWLDLPAMYGPDFTIKH